MILEFFKIGGIFIMVFMIRRVFDSCDKAWRHDIEIINGREE